MPVEVREKVLELDGREIPYALVRRSGRRRVTLELAPREGLKVVAPLRFPLRDVDALLREERDWLRRNLREWESWERRHPPRRFVSGETLSLLGERWPLTVKEEPGRRRPAIQSEMRARGAGRVTLVMPAGMADAARRALAARSLERWYRHLARRILAARVRHWEDRLGPKVKAISLRDMRSRWASCGTSGRLSFNWKIVMAPPPVLDYLVVHEICHLIHLDHSPAFWRRVGEALPHYRSLRAWLRKHGESLYL